MIRNTVRAFLATLLAVGLLSGVAQAATSAQFIMSPAANLFVFDNLGPGSASLSASDVPVSYEYSNITDLPVQLQGSQSARVTVNMPASSNATQVVGTNIQPFTGLVNSISIVLVTPVFGLTNLLTANLTGGKLVGSEGGAAASYSAWSGAALEDVVFTSDFLSFAGATSRSASLTFTSVTPALVFLGYTQPLADFIAAASGTFSSEPSPDVSIPEPKSSLLVGFGLVAVGLVLRRVNSRRGKSA